MLSVPRTTSPTSQSINNYFGLVNIATNLKNQIEKILLKCCSAYFVKMFLAQTGVCWVEVRGDCSFYWYWWNCWPSLFKLSFHNSSWYLIPFLLNPSLMYVCQCKLTFVFDQPQDTVLSSCWAHKTSLTPPLFIEVPVQSQESEWSCICV